MKFILAGLYAIVVVLAMIAVAFSIGGIALHYSLTIWLPHIVHHAVNIPWVPCLVVGLLGDVFIPIALITWLLVSCGVV